MHYNPDCTKCPLYERTEHVCMAARVAHEEREVGKHDNIDVLMVGEVPGPDEEREGRPFMGGNGGLLSKALEILADDSELDISRIALTYAVRCYPGRDKKPGVKAKRECNEFILAEIAELAPSLVLLLGGGAASAFTGGDVTAVGASRLRTIGFCTTGDAPRWVHQSGAARPDGLDASAIPVGLVYHPSAVLYNRGLTQDFLDDLNAWLVEKIYEEKPDTGLDEVPVRLINTDEHFALLTKVVARNTTIGLDIETDGFTPHVLTIAIAIPGGNSYTVPVFHPEGKVDGESVLGWVVDSVLRNPNITVVGQNIKYDITMLMRATGNGKLPALCKTADSMLYHYMMNEHSTSRNLDYLSRAYSSIGGYKDDVDHGNLISEPLESLARYNGRDAALPLQIIQKISARMESQRTLSPIMEEFYSRLTPFVAQMESAGMRVCQEQLQLEEKKIEKEKQNLEDDLGLLAPDVLLTSPKQLSEFIYTTLGNPIPDVLNAVGKSGQPSTRADVIAHIDHDFTRMLVQYRTQCKLHNTFVAGIWEALWPNSFVHPSYYIAKTEYGGTVTGRLSCKNPAMQTIPKGTTLRRVFVPRNEYGILLGIDASQAELRVAASYSNDSTLVDLFNSGADIHQTTADTCNVDRPTGKMINFASIYGVSAWGLEERAGLSSGLARRVAKKVKTEWAGLYGYFDKIKQTATMTGQVCTPYGRWRRIPGANPSDPKGRALLREAANFVIQSSASDFVQMFGWRLSHVLAGVATPVLSNHDGLVFDIFHKKDVLDVVGMILTEQTKFATMVQSMFGVDLLVPFEWDIETGLNLYDMEELPNA